MTDLRKAAEIALEALLEANNSALMELSIDNAYSDEITALRQALAQPEQAPFGYFYEINGTYTDFSNELPPDDGYDKRTLVPVFTAPAKRGAGGAQSEQRAAWQGNGGAGYNVGGTGVDKPEQEPVRWFQQFGDAPPQREWVGLHLDDMPEDHVVDKSFLRGARWAEAKLKEKNT